MQSYRILILFGIIIIVFVIYMLVSDNRTAGETVVKLSSGFVDAYNENNAEGLKQFIDESITVTTHDNGDIVSVKCGKINLGGAFAEMPEVTYTYKKLKDAFQGIDKITPKIFASSGYRSVSYDQLVTFYFREEGEELILIYIALKPVDEEPSTLSF